MNYSRPLLSAGGRRFPDRCGRPTRLLPPGHKPPQAALGAYWKVREDRGVKK